MCAASTSHPAYLASEVANDQERNHVIKEEPESVTFPCTEPFAMTPWPYLSSFFRCVCEKERTYTFQCILCQPKQNMLSASKTSSTNLRTHIQRVHPHKVEEMKILQKGSRKRSLPAEGSSVELTAANAQPSTAQAFQDPAHFFEGPAPVSQSRFNQLIFRFIVQGLHPLDIVERPAFRELFREVIPTRCLMSRETLAKMVDDEFVCVKSNLLFALEKQEYVATTADVWKSDNKSFLGVTVHWIGQDTLGVNSGVIACRRLKGNCTSAALARVLVDIHRDFNIEQKVALTTTDNGSNFAKAFAPFADAQMEEWEEEGKDGGDADEDGLRFSEVTDVLGEGGDVGGYRLPPRQRCACHALNLVATEDAEGAAESSQSFKRISREAIAKCQALWNKQNRSAEASDIIQEGLGCQLKVPNVTRWNSTFQALERLRTCTAGRERNLDEVCARLDVPQFKKAELTFIQEYVTTMAPLAKALDVLQSDKMAYYGVLLPTISILLQKLQKVKLDPGLVHCEPLADALIGGVKRRLGYVFESRRSLMATVSHPMFRLEYIPSDRKDSVRSSLREEVGRLEALPGHLDPEAEDPSSEEDDVASFFPKKKEDGNLNEVEVFLHSSETSLLTAFAGLPRLRRVFLKYNTGVPASAACERLFGAGGNVFTAKSNRFSDKDFERLLMCRSNHKFCFTDMFL